MFLMSIIKIFDNVGAKMDIRNIHTFIRVAELKSFTKAAEELNYVQSTVTMQIQQLEKELGYPLFDRIGKKVSLTSLGVEFLTYAYEILHAVEKAEMLGKDSGDIHGVLRLGVSESILFGAMMDILPAFKAKYKNLDLRIKTGHTTELLEQLKHNQLDMLYLSANLNTEPELRRHYVHRENIVFLSGSGHSLAQRKKIPLQELMTYDFLVTEREGICYGRLRELTEQYNVTFSDLVEIDNIFVIAELVEKGMGLAFLPEYAVQKRLEEGTLVRLNVDVTPQIYYSQVLCHKSRWMSPFMAGLIEMIQESRPSEETYEVSGRG